MRLAPLHRLVKRDVSYEFMNRQMVWHAFTVSSTDLYTLVSVHRILFQEFLLFLLPLIPASSIRRNLTRLTTSITLTSISSHIPTPLHSILGFPSRFFPLYFRSFSTLQPPHWNRSTSLPTIHTVSCILRRCVLLSLFS